MRNENQASISLLKARCSKINFVLLCDFVVKNPQKNYFFKYKKSMIMKNLVVIIISIFMLTTFAAKAEKIQYPTNEVETKIVLATSGLNLRQEPSLDSKVLKLVAYGDRVAILEEKVKTDTIQLNKTKQLSGHWVKVAHRATQGYMFSAFLAKMESEYFPEELIDEDFALLYPGCGCGSSLQYRRDFEYTGVYQTPSRKFRSKKVNPSFYSKQGSIVDLICVKTDEVEEEILFIVGSRNKKITTYGKGQLNLDFYDYGFDKKHHLNEDLFFDEEDDSLHYCYNNVAYDCLLYTSPSPRDATLSRMPSSA